MEQPIVNARSARWKSYVVAFVITGLMFGTALVVSNYFNNQRVEDIRETQDDLSTQILSLETQFDLLSEHSCGDISENTILPSEMTALGSQLSSLEAQDGDTDEVTSLKSLYSVLEIKDYIVMQELAAKCNLNPVFILYFYSNSGDCTTECEDQGDVLTSLSETYPQLHVYSFDYNLQVGALQTLISIDNVQDNPPALVINGKVYYGFQSLQDIQKILPQLATLQKATSTAATSSAQ